MCSDPESDIHKYCYDIANTAEFLVIELVKFGHAAPEQREAR